MVAGNVDTRCRSISVFDTFHFPGEGCFTKHHLEENKTTEPASSVEIQADINKRTDQEVDVILGDGKIDNIAGSEKFELPAPEKLLSVPEGFADLQDNFMESTPDGAHLLSGGGDDAGININSQKKRSFTESTLTVQSLDSVESLAGARSKRTKEYIPDDDDLLASILGIEGFFMEFLHISFLPKSN